MESNDECQKTLEKINRYADDFIQSQYELDDYLHQNFKLLRGDKRNNFDDTSQWILNFNAVPPSLLTLFQNAMSSLSPLYQQIHKQKLRIENYLNKESGTFSSQVQKKAVQWLIVSNQITSFVEETLHCLKMYLDIEQYPTDAQKNASGICRWINFDTSNKVHHFVMSANQRNIASAFQENIANEVDALIMTSATLEIQHSFAFFSEQLGLGNGNKPHVTKKVDSPFNYNSATCHTPLIHGDANAPEHSHKVACQIELSYQRHKAMLVLFSSQKQLYETYLCLPKTLQRKTLCPNTYSKGELIHQHKKQIDAGEASIILGLDSLAEGLDLQRDYLTCVIIAKLPFINLNHPMFHYDGLALDMQGKSSFTGLSLPICERKLIQAVGRLMRTEQDYGEVFIMDPRMNQKDYARSMFHNLPIVKAQNKRMN